MTDGPLAPGNLDQTDVIRLIRTARDVVAARPLITPLPLSLYITEMAAALSFFDDVRT